MHPRAHPAEREPRRSTGACSRPDAGIGARIIQGVQAAVAQEPEQAVLASAPRRTFALAPGGGDESPELPDIQIRRQCANVVEDLVVTHERVAQPFDSTMPHRFAPARPAYRVERPRNRVGVAFPEQACDVADLPSPGRAFETAGIGHRGLEIRPHGDSGEIVCGQQGQGLAERLQRERFALAL